MNTHRPSKFRSWLPEVQGDSGIPKRVFLGLLGLMAAANVLMVDIPERTLQGGNDFLSLYAGGKLATDPGLYNHNAIQQVQQSVGWHSAELAYTRPPFYAGILWPISQVTYPVAVKIWFALNLAALIVLFLLMLDTFPVLLTAFAILASMPLYAAFVNGQDIPILMSVLAGSRLLLKRDLPVASGFLLSFCAIKFHLFLTLPLYLIRRKQWRLSAGLLAGTMMWILLSFLLQGMRWPVRYGKVLLAPSTNPGLTYMPNLHGIFAGLERSALFEITGAIIICVVCWFAVGHKSETSAYAGMLISGLLVSHHAYVQDAAVLLPVEIALLSGSNTHAVRLLTLACLCPVLWVLLRVPTLSAIPAICLIVLLLLITRESLYPKMQELLQT
jgi:hypothetical protein